MQGVMASPLEWNTRTTTPGNDATRQAANGDSIGYAESGRTTPLPDQPDELGAHAAVNAIEERSNHSPYPVENYSEVQNMIYERGWNEAMKYIQEIVKTVPSLKRESTQPGESPLCTGCHEKSMVRVALIGDIKICPKCIHLLMDIVEAEAPEAASWLPMRESSEPILQEAWKFFNAEIDDMPLLRAYMSNRIEGQS